MPEWHYIEAQLLDARTVEEIDSIRLPPVSDNCTAYKIAEHEFKQRHGEFKEYAFIHLQYLFPPKFPPK